MNANCKITVKYLGPSTTKGARFAVKSDNVTHQPTKYVARDYDLGGDSQVEAIIDERIKAIVAAKRAWVQQTYGVAGSGIEPDRVVIAVSEVVTWARAGVTEALVRITTEVRQ